MSLDRGFEDPARSRPRNHHRDHVSGPEATLRGGDGLHWTLLGVLENRVGPTPGR